ncbi:hypothetical protein DO97_18025 [Neosynechococcus sphagnicola sy1]|uniref:Uncharacterized protein n=1 Tax=Neosynechococcus sphagnicola sy1 TaxID=1497020 RepID=A0A098TG21_9CYAN|nr:hypothetical protein DO97_18025 [Neosynechococcus sphagnicola sy1]
MIKHSMCGLKVVIMPVDHPVKFMGHLRQTLDVLCLKYRFQTELNIWCFYLKGVRLYENKS